VARCGRQDWELRRPLRATSGLVKQSGQSLALFGGVTGAGASIARYFSIDAGVRFDCVRSDLHTIRWQADGDLSADFILPGTEGRTLRVRFNGPTIVRLLDEMPLSTEQRTKNDGLVSRHFAYRVEGSTFAETQSEAGNWLVIPFVITS